MFPDVPLNSTLCSSTQERDPKEAHLTGRVGGEGAIGFLVYVKLLRSVQEGSTKNPSVPQILLVRYPGLVLWPTGHQVQILT